MQIFTIRYSNHFKIGGKTFAFRKNELFDITGITPIHLPIQNNGCKGYWICREWYSLSALESIIIKEPIEIDISHLQWWQQEILNGVFNLETIST